MLMDMAMGDTEAFLSSEGGEPNAAAGADESAGEDENTEQAGAAGGDAGQAGAQDEPNLDELTPDNAVILAKDKVHTIGFEKLLDERKGRQTAEQEAQRQREVAEQQRDRADAAERQLAELQAQAQARVDAGEAPTRTDKLVEQAAAAIEQGADISLFGDFSEEALAGGIDKRIDQKNAALEERVARLETNLAPIQQKQATDARQVHLNAIYSAHPDADSIVESKELSDWVSQQPSFVRDRCAQVLKEGTTAEVIELFDTFKKSTGVATAGQGDQPSAQDAKARAQEALRKTQAEPPASLSDIPGGKPAAGNRFEALSQMSAAEQADAMQEWGWSQEQINAFLDKHM